MNTLKRFENTRKKFQKKINFFLKYFYNTKNAQNKRSVAFFMLQLREEIAHDRFCQNICNKPNSFSEYDQFCFQNQASNIKILQIIFFFKNKARAQI